MHVVLQVARVDHGEDVGHVQIVRVPGEVNLRSSNINIPAIMCYNLGGHESQHWRSSYQFDQKCINTITIFGQVVIKMRAVGY